VSGGESVTVSGHTAYNTLLGARPDLVDELYGTFCFDRSKETGSGEEAVENRRCLVRLWLAGKPQSLAVTPSRRRKTDCGREHAALLTTAG
jgi:hypothetical protein